MTHQASPTAAPSGSDPGRQMAQLHELLALVETIAGRSGRTRLSDTLLNDAANLSGAYDQALPVVQRRFQALAGETAGWAAAGVEALLAGGLEAPPRAAAARLAMRVESALRDMASLLK